MKTMWFLEPNVAKAYMNSVCNNYQVQSIYQCRHIRIFVSCHKYIQYHITRYSCTQWNSDLRLHWGVVDFNAKQQYLKFRLSLFMKISNEVPVERIHRHLINCFCYKNINVIIVSILYRKFINEEAWEKWCLSLCLSVCLSVSAFSFQKSVSFKSVK